MADSAILNRLVFESHVMVLAQLPESVSNPDGGSTRRLPAVGRQAKMMDLGTRIAGVSSAAAGTFSCVGSGVTTMGVTAIGICAAGEM